MSKFDFFEEGVRRVFENYELPAGDNAWSDFQSKVGSGASSGSFMKHFILPGIIVGGIIGAMNLSSTNDHSTQHNDSQIEHSSQIAQTEENLTETIEELNSQEKAIAIDSQEFKVSEIVSEETIDIKKTNTSTKNAASKTNGGNNNYDPQVAQGGNSGSTHAQFESEIESMKTKETIQYKGTAYKLGAPSKFTPNNDNRGDYFMPSELNAESNFVLEIVDSNKNLVFKSKSVKNKWGGNIQDSGKRADQGDYHWRVLKISDDKQEIFQGKVKLVR